MNANATVTVKSRQVYTDNIEDGELDMVTEGEYTVEKDGFKLVYRETPIEDSPEHVVYTTVQTVGDTVSMWRTDTALADMVFEKGKRHHAMMNTDAGVLPLCVITKSILQNLDEHGGQLRLRYKLELGGHELSENTIHFKINA